jgi:outer membrane protein assembly factor BamB
LAIVSSVTYGMVGLKLENKNGKPDYEQVWKNDSLTCYFATPVVVGEDLYVVTGQLVPPTAKLHCVEPGTGKVLWSKAGVGTYHASLLLAKDRLLLLEEKGDLVLVQPDKTGYKELARSKVCNNTWAHPALANGQIYVRDAKEILCYTLKK